MKIRPLYDTVLVQILDAEEKTKGGIILPDTAKEEKLEGKVIAIGSGKRLENGQIQLVDLKKGEKVIFKRYGTGEDIMIDGVKHKILKAEDILAVIED